ncbi:sensor histidine kinase [Allosphingosinicella deserti]|uniref:sensor histidine kinase n=1 Tax=Allosphingosinicella deserti TaxID=2116704 RepID=UPI001304A6E9|nr:ATP-binding protein [Sphingomonas deserti]
MLRSLRFEAVIVCLLVLTLLAVVFEDAILRQEIRFSPAIKPDYVGYAYSDEQIGGTSSVTADAREPMAWRCALRRTVEIPYCGYELLFDAENHQRGIDLSNVTSMKLKFDYKGPSRTVRVFFKNYDPRYSLPKRSETAKYNQIEFDYPRGTEEVTLAPDNFSVAEWWVTQHHVPPELSRPQFDNVISLSIHTGTVPGVGEHAFRIREIVLEGRRLGAAQWYLGIIAVWLVLIGGFLFYRIAHLKEEIAAREEAAEREKTIQDQLIYVSRVNAMGEMGSALAHELNQPLAAVSNYMSIAKRLLIRQREGDAAQALDAIGAAQETALRAGEIIRRLREMVRGSVTRQGERLAEIIDKIGSIAFLEADLQGIRHRVIVHDPDAHVLVDRIQVQQVLLNLIRNAFEAMQGSAVRSLVVETRAVDGPMIEIAVSDTGSGIPSDAQDMLFTAFRTTKKDGMGIGLSICRTIVEAHGGRIWAEPRAGGGTVFRFTIPEAAETEDVSAKAA